MTLDDLPVSEAFSPRKALSPEDRAQDQASFIADVTNKIKREGYRITDRRIFRCVGYVPTIGPQWVVLHAEVGNTLMETFKGREVFNHIDSHGPHALSIWRLPHRQAIAVAQSFDLPDGAVLVGYFMLSGKQASPLMMIEKNPDPQPSLGHARISGRLQRS